MSCRMHTLYLLDLFWFWILLFPKLSLLKLLTTSLFGYNFRTLENICLYNINNWFSLPNFCYLITISIQLTIYLHLFSCEIHEKRLCISKDKLVLIHIV